jgi:hypothetical protein
MPIFRPAEQSALDLRAQAAVQTSAIPGSVTDFSDREESKIKHMDGYVEERINQLGSALLAISLLLELRRYFEARRHAAEQAHEPVRNIDIALEILSRRERSYIKNSSRTLPDFLDQSVTELIEREVPKYRTRMEELFPRKLNSEKRPCLTKK